ncbi:esterase OVCA2 isoform X2 [Neoarius graeffei]|uniref:esterase OVCA2 isoform X2 n=1 Tax=Neoarius graeffei TaxID=443677 RepID=UPI00298CF78D|nr:esterase OVCA2 isoform X2 [Neoarius graeffei]
MILHCSFDSYLASDLPVMELAVNGEVLPFLIDTGATMSSVGNSYEDPISNKTVRSVGIDGVPFSSPCTPPLLVTCPADTALRKHHSFVLMPQCPFNLMGRDLMSLLHLSISFQGSKITICTPDSLPPALSYLSSHVTVPNISAVCMASVNTVISSTDPSTALTEIPSSLWAEQKDEVGLVHCVPYEAKLKHMFPVYVNQYPLSEDKAKGIDVILQSLLEQGVVRECTSPYNTPVNPVPKPDGTWRFTQDLRKINELIVPVAPIVPDVSSVISQVPADHCCFSVIDLCSAFFSVPVEENTQPLFAFTHRRKQYTWTRLPQGFIDSLAVFSAVIRNALCDLSLPQGSVVLTYTDDLLVSAESPEICRDASLRLLQHLVQKGFKVSRTKLQFCKDTVKYLGFELSQGCRKLSADRVQAILDTKRPATKHALMSFLGLINYCRQWIPDCSSYDKILRSAISHQDPQRHPLTWTDTMINAYHSLKSALCSAPALGLPDYSKPFHLYACEQQDQGPLNCTQVRRRT